MPRPAAPDTCKTCRIRKIKCDGRLPVCLRCQRQNLFCDRSSKLVLRQYNGPASNTVVRKDTSPTILLQDPVIARIFHLYIKELAPWYDLNDSAHRSFGELIPTAALTNPLLFSAIIAFGGTYGFRKYKFPTGISETYHHRCVELLISLSADDETVANGIALSATCLLRSYEILAEKEDPNRHLFGASTLLPPTPKIWDRGLIPCAFWNYLREDITYSLVYECPLKIQVGLLEQDPVTDDEFANSITLLLAMLVNAHFGGTTVDLLPQIQHWRQRFPAIPFSRCEVEPFPTVRMLKDCHVAAMHYYHVAICMTQPERSSSQATEICGLAISSESDAVIVNSYGPICFACKWLTEADQRGHLVGWLRGTQKQTAWSVEVLVQKLQNSWIKVCM